MNNPFTLLQDIHDDIRAIRQALVLASARNECVGHAWRINTDSDGTREMDGHGVRPIPQNAGGRMKVTRKVSATIELDDQDVTDLCTLLFSAKREECDRLNEWKLNCKGALREEQIQEHPSVRLLEFADRMLEELRA